MQFCFCPKHEYACPQISHCPHLGGAALGTLVYAASDQDEYVRMLRGQLDFERGRNTKLFEENVRYFPANRVPDLIKEELHGVGIRIALPH